MEKTTAKSKRFPDGNDSVKGILLAKGGNEMKIKGWAITMGVGAAVGAVAVMMLPKQSPARKLVNKAAIKVDDAMQDLGEKISEKWV